MAGLKPTWLDFMNRMNIKQDTNPYIMFLLREIYDLLEDVYSVSTITELQEAIDGIGDGAGTIFIAAGTYIVDTTIDLDQCGSLVIYGHGDNTILKANDGINIFNITCCQRLIMRTLKLDVTNYTSDIEAIICNETNNNILTFTDLTIDGAGSFGIGIEFDSDNCIVEHCNITDMTKGIHIDNSDSHIITNNTITGHDGYGIHAETATKLNIQTNNCGLNGLYGIYFDTITYSTISGNICNSNTQTGIYCDSSTNNTIANNSCNSNAQNGIYITNCSYNTISSNTLNSNDSDTANAQAGLYITTGSDFNTITGNNVNNNNNAGVGLGYGIYIATPDCDENVIASNNSNGNDIDYEDEGTATTITYYVQNNDELQDAIDSIGTGTGTVIITAGTISITAALDIDGSGSYIIQGQGDNTVLTTSGDITCFNITSAISCVIKDLKIDASSVTTQTKEIISITEASNNKITVDNIKVIGTNAKGYAIAINSDYCLVTNCDLGNDLRAGVYVSGNKASIIGNIVHDNTASFGIRLDGSSYCFIQQNRVYNTTDAITVSGASINCSVLGNIVYDNKGVGIVCYQGSYHIIEGNIIYDNNISGTVTAGINLNQTDNCTIVGNSIKGNAGGILLSGNADNNSIQANIVIGNGINNMGSVHGGIRLSGSDYNTILSNIIQDHNNGGAGDMSGIYLDSADYTVVGGNNISGNDISFSEITSTGTIKYGDDTIYGVGWNGNLGTATKNTIYDKIELVIAGAAANAFKTITGITNDVVADAVDDILTLAAVGGLTILGNAGTDTITFTNTITQYDNAMADARIAAADHDTLLNPNGNANEQHMTAAQIAALHAIQVAGDFLHNSLGGIDAGDINHLTDVQVAALHAAAHLHDTDILELDGIDSNIGAFPFDTTGIVTFNQDVTVPNLITAGNIDGVDVSTIVTFKTITGITNDVVADLLTDTLTLAAVGGLTIVGTAATDTITFTNTITQYNDAMADARIALAHHDTLLFPNGNANEQHMTAAQIAALHAIQVAGDFNHNDLANLNAGDVYEHISAAQLAALHAATNSFVTITGITNNVVADGVADTLTFVVGAGLTIVGTTATDTITFTNTITQYTNAMAHAFIEANALTLTADVTFNAGQLFDGEDVSALAADLANQCTTAEAIAAVVAENPLTLTNDLLVSGGGITLDNQGAGGNPIIHSNSASQLVDITGMLRTSGNIIFSGAQTVDGKDVSTLGTDAEAHAYVEANALTMTQVITFDAAQLFDGVDVSALSITNMPTAVNNWKMYATNGAGIMTELAVGAAGTILTGAGVGAAPSFQAAATEVPTHFYFVATDAEFDAAIAAIAAATPIDGRIIVTANLTDVQATINAANCSFIIEGIGEDVALDANGDNAVITVTTCAGLIIRNLTFDLTDHLNVGTPAIDINGGSNICVENCDIVGDNVNSIGITINTAVKVQILNNRITDTADGIFIDTDDNLIKGNIINSVADDGIHISTNADNNLITGNIIETTGDDGILIDAGADDNQLSDNTTSGIGGSRVADAGTNTIYGARYS